MKLFTKGKMFESLDTMAVTGENDEELYYLKKDTSSAGHVVTLSGADGGKIVDIEQRGNGGKASFAVIMNGRKLRWRWSWPSVWPFIVLPWLGLHRRRLSWAIKFRSCTISPCSCTNAHGCPNS